MNSNAPTRQYLRETAFETWIGYVEDRADPRIDVLMLVGATPQEVINRAIARLEQIDEYQPAGPNDHVRRWIDLLRSQSAETWAECACDIPGMHGTFRMTVDRGFDSLARTESIATGVTGTLKLMGNPGAVKRRLVTWCEQEAAALGSGLPEGWDDLDDDERCTAFFGRGGYGASCFTHSV